MLDKRKSKKQIKLHPKQENQYFPFLSYFLSIRKSIDHLGNEKIKILKLIWSITKDTFSFEKYLDAAIVLLGHANKSFIETRSGELLTWLLEKFLNSREVTTSNSRCTVQTFIHTITFPFRTKEVLSFFIETKNSSLNFDTIKKIISENYQEVTFVEGSFISVTSQNDEITKYYLEVQKEGVFSKKEISTFQSTLPKVIKDFLKKPKTQFIVPSNRELLIKSFQWIIKDLNKKDIPHVFIDFNIQTTNSFQFSVLICCAREYEDVSLKEKLNHQDIHIEYTNTLEEKKYLKEGIVLTIDVAADPSLSIIDARKKSSLLIQDLIGPFRDVNGGLLEQIEHNFDLLCSEITAPIEDLKSFFYRITPQERQATAPIQLLKKIYISMNKYSLDNEIDYFIEEDSDILCITVKTTHPGFEKEFRHLLITKFPEIIIASSYAEDVVTVSCAYLKSDQNEIEILKNLTFSLYKYWCEKKELKQVLRLGCTTEFLSFDPRIGTEEESSCLLKMLFEGLTKIGKNGTPEEALAKKIEISNSGLLYRFFLRKSYWSNKEIVTAYDFAYSWKTSLKPDFSSPLSYLFYPIKNAKAVKEGEKPPSMLGIKIIDDFTFEVELQYPCPYFLELCAHSAFSPICKSIDINNPSWPKSFGESYVCNGPFITDKIASKEIILKKNPLFWEKKRVFLEKVIISNMTERDSVSLFQRKKIDALFYPFFRNLVSGSIDTLKIQKKKCVTEMKYLGFDCTKPPFSNKKMRMAFSLALQRDILSQAFSSYSKPAYAPYAPKFSQLDLSKDSEENQTLAKKLFFESLEEMKLKPDVFNQRKVCATYNSSGIGKIIADQLNNLFGINLQPAVVDISKYFSMIRNKQIGIFIYAWINRIQDPIYFLNSFTSLGNIINYTSWNSLEVEYLSKSIQKISCLKTRKKLHYQAEMLLYQEKPIAPLLATSVYSQIQPHTQNVFVGDSLEFDIRYTYKK